MQYNVNIYSYQVTLNRILSCYVILNFISSADK